MRLSSGTSKSVTSLGCDLFDYVEGHQIKAEDPFGDGGNHGVADLFLRLKFG